jgi:hypothetical protein
MKSLTPLYLAVVVLSVLAIAVLEFKALSMGIDGKCLSAAFLAIGGSIGSVVTVFVNSKRKTKEVSREEVKQ